MEEIIKALKIMPYKAPELVEIHQDLVSLQAEVEGYIEAYYPFPENVCVICNEEGKMNGMLPNRAIYDPDDEDRILDIVFGPMLIVGINDNDEDFRSLTDNEAASFLEKFEYPESFYRTSDGEIHAKKIL